MALPTLPKQRSVRWWVLRCARGALFFYVVYAGLMFLLQRSLIFPAWVLPVAPLVLPEGGELWSRELEGGGRVEAFFLPAQGPATGGRPTVLYFHGNGERADDWFAALSPYRRAGMNVFVMEYRGYSRSAGSPSREALVEDARFFLARVLSDPRVDGSRLVFHGRSLGGGVAVELASHHAPRTLVLQSTFSQLSELALRRGLPRSLVRDDFDNASRLRRLDIPVLLAHGRHDSVIPYAHVEQLASAARSGRLITYEADHNDCPPDFGAYLSDVLLFLSEVRVVESASLRQPAVSPGESEGAQATEAHQRARSP